MSTTHVIWCGPVSSKQVSGAQIPGAMVHYITCTGDGKPTCGEMAQAWTDASGRVLPGLLASQKIVLAPDDQLWFGAFSAGGQIVKRCMLNADDRAMITGALLADADYEATWIDQAAKIAPPTEGYVLYALDCMKDGRIFVATSSANVNMSVQNPGLAYPSGNQELRATLAEIERRSGVTFVDVTAVPAAWPWNPTLKAPVQVWRYNNVVFADYGSAYQHPEHATILAPAIWPAIPQILADVEPSQTGLPLSTTASQQASDYVSRVSGWWNGMSTTGKVVLGGVAATAALLLLRRK